MKNKQQDKNQKHLKQYFELPNPGLRAYFEHTRLGQPDDYRTPLWKGEARKDVIDRWARVVKKAGLADKLPSLAEYEEEMKHKIGPMSIQVPLDDRLEDIQAYYSCPKKGIDSQRLEQGRARLLEEWASIKGLRMRSIDNTLKSMKLNTNSGAPYFTKRSNPKAMEQAEEMASDYGPNGCHVEPEPGACAVLGWRGQEGGPKDTDVKQRVVWMMPMGLNLAEARVYQPLIEALQSRKLFPAYISNEAVDQHITDMFDTKSINDVVICTDFTKYDQHFNTGLQDSAKLVIQDLFTKEDDFNFWLFKVFPEKYNLPIQCDTTLYFEGPHGMASGSGGTNVDESIVHRTLQHQVAYDNGQLLNRYSQCNGDDGILTFPGITVDKVIDTYTALGLEMNPDKQYVSKHECVYLRRWHADYYRKNDVCVGVYSTFRALGKLLGQERFYDPEKWSREMVVLRCLSILENCKWHPLFHEFIDFVLEGDKFRLGLNLPGFFDKLNKYVKEAIDMKDSFLGYTRTNMKSSADGIEGINNWEVVKYLKSKIER